MAIIVAITAQWIESQNDPGYRFVNFFGYFTIQSNIFVGAVFLVAAAYGLRSRSQPGWLTVAHAATITYIATTGVVYNLLLANGPLGDFNVAWSNNILHRVIPVVAVLQWILFGDRSSIAWKRLWYFLIYPVIWLIVILLRGQDFVPYPFLNVVTIGAGSVTLYCIAITAFVVGMSALVIWVSRLRILRPDSDLPRQERASVSST
ncbi:Pr6Pr family membrane protein [Frondihabitans sucicola]|uniref:Pr6Pr family membrane protein n=1 Tax=Frondihabitans sucicola TaxID=1268041 RepID=UPI00257449C2|nr:Pr6Pr family membrane protein [Frondihabitans sucicola]